GGGGTDRRRRVADLARLGGVAQRRGSERAPGPQDPGPGAAPDSGAARSAGAGGRGRTEAYLGARCAGDSAVAAWLRQEFGVAISETTVSRALKRLGF